MFFELHKSNGEFHVEIFYKSYRGDDPVPLEPISIPNCGQKCSLEKLYVVYQDILPTKDYDDECHVPQIVQLIKSTTEKVAFANGSNKCKWNFPFCKLLVCLISFQIKCFFFLCSFAIDFHSPAWLLTGLIALLVFY